MVSGINIFFQPKYTDYVVLYLVADLPPFHKFLYEKNRSPLAMKILFALFVLFAVQIVPLEAQMHRKNNALGITGFDKPEIKFWGNPFSSGKKGKKGIVFVKGFTEERGKGGEGGPFDD